VSNIPVKDEQFIML